MTKQHTIKRLPKLKKAKKKNRKDEMTREKKIIPEKDRQKAIKLTRPLKTPKHYKTPGDRN